MESVFDKNKEVCNSAHIFTGKGKCQVQTAVVAMKIDNFTFIVQKLCILFNVPFVILVLS